MGAREKEPAREPSIVGINLRKYRRAVGLSQSSLARRAALTRTIVQKLESGTTDNPSYNTMAALADALGIPTAAMVEERVEHQNLAKAVRRFLATAMAWR